VYYKHSKVTEQALNEVGSAKVRLFWSFYTIKF